MWVIPFGVVERLLEIVKEARLFKRNKVSLRHKVRACILYMAGLSTREIACTVQAVPASREAVRQWVARLATLSKALEPRVRSTVAVDETKLKLNGRPLYVWAAVDARELLAMRVSWQRSILDAEIFLRKVLEPCIGKLLILVDKGP